MTKTCNREYGSAIPFELFALCLAIHDASRTAFMDGAALVLQLCGELGKLMQDLHCKKADEMHSPILAKRVYELKETQKGVELMCHEMEKIYSEGMESGEKRGELKKAKETALSMAEEGMDVKMIARLVKVSEKDVQKWIDENLCAMK